MEKIMFICTGNIGRSPMAEAILQKITIERQLDVQAYSSGIYAYDGDLPEINAVQAMKEKGIDITSHRAINIKNSDIEMMDLILCLTYAQKIYVMNAYPNLKERIYTLKEYVGEEEKDIKDPWGYDREVYEKIADEIEEKVKLLILKIQKEIDKEK